jgi:hypothetical protein
MTDSPTTPTGSQTTYRPHARYVLITAIAALSIPALIWLLLRGVDLAGVLFLIFAAGLLFFALRGLLSRVEVDNRGLTLLQPLARPQQVQYRQLAEVSEEGRLQRVILLLYHPLRPDGLLDLDDLCSLALPALEEQSDLLEILQARTLHR